MEKLIQSLYNEAKENIEYYYPFEDSLLHGKQYLIINGFTIEIHTGVGYGIEIRKDGILIYKKETETFFFNKWGRKFFKLIERQVQIRRQHEKEKEELEEQMENEKLQSFISNGIDTWISELEGIPKYEKSEDFDEVMKDINRLKEISKEAQQIHDKYKKPFFNVIFKK